MTGFVNPADLATDGKLFVAHTTQAQSVKNIFEVLRACLFDICVCATEAGLASVALDSSKSAMISMQLDSGSFDLYHCRTAKVLIGVCLSNLVKLLSCVTAADSLTLAVLDSDVDSLVVTVHGRERRSQYRLRLMNLAQPVVDIPKSEFTTVLLLPSEALQRLVREASSVGDCVTISTNAAENGIDLAVEGDYASQKTTLIESCTSAEGGQPKDVNQKDVCFGTFSLKFLTLFAKASCLSSSVNLFIREGMIVLSYNAQLGKTVFILGAAADTE